MENDHFVKAMAMFASTIRVPLELFFQKTLNLVFEVILQPPKVCLGGCKISDYLND